MSAKWTKGLLVIVTVLMASPIQSQFVRKIWHLSAGPTLSGTYYIGELKGNPFPEEYYLKPSIGAHATYQAKNVFAFQLGVNQGWLAGADSLVNASRYRRGFHFKTAYQDIYLNGKLFLLNHKKRFTRSTQVLWYPKLIAGAGVVHFNPKAEYNGEWYALQELGTSGQQIENGVRTYEEPYARWAFNYKIGGELSFMVGRRTSLDLFLIYTFTTTDYLDDVGSGGYVAKEDLQLSENPEALGALGYPLNGDFVPREGKARGNPDTMDAFVNGGASLSYRLTGVSRRGRSFGRRSRF